MNHCRFLVCLSLALGPIVAHAEEQATSAKASYGQAIDALKKNDCKAAIYYLEKYKREAAAQLEKRPDFAKRIDLQIAECRDPGSEVTLKLIADADTAPGSDLGAAGGITAGVAIGGILLILILLILVF